MRRTRQIRKRSARALSTRSCFFAPLCPAIPFSAVACDYRPSAATHSTSCPSTRRAPFPDLSACCAHVIAPAGICGRWPPNIVSGSRSVPLRPATAPCHCAQRPPVRHCFRRPPYAIGSSDHPSPLRPATAPRHCVQRPLVRDRARLPHPPPHPRSLNASLLTQIGYHLEDLPKGPRSARPHDIAGEDSRVSESLRITGATSLFGVPIAAAAFDPSSSAATISPQTPAVSPAPQGAGFSFASSTHGAGFLFEPLIQVTELFFASSIAAHQPFWPSPAKSSACLARTASLPPRLPRSCRHRGRSCRLRYRFRPCRPPRLSRSPGDRARKGRASCAGGKGEGEGRCGKEEAGRGRAKPTGHSPLRLATGKHSLHLPDR